MRTLYIILLFAVILTSVAACDGEEDAATPGVEASDGEGESSAGYRVVLGNAITDTLRGRATFGTVVEPESGQARLVIRLASDFDFAGGIVMARRDTVLPDPGSYSFQQAADSLAGIPPGDFILFYREGMLRDMRAASGSMTLSTVTDSLVRGTFDVMLRGRTAGIDRSGTGSEVHATGRFEARRGLEGFVIGL